MDNFYRGPFTLDIVTLKVVFSAALPWLTLPLVILQQKSVCSAKSKQRKSHTCVPVSLLTHSMYCP